MDLHGEVRAALASTPAATGMAASLSRPTVQETLDTGLGTAPLRRLTAFYAHGAAATSFNEATIRDDISWVTTHLDEWMKRQMQAQDDAQALLATLNDRWPRPAHTQPQATAEELLAAVQAVRRMPGHWLHRPWAQQLLGRWTESLPSAVAQARRWLAEHPAPQQVGNAGTVTKGFVSVEVRPDPGDEES